jgi:hypothetical protein
MIELDTIIANVKNDEINDLLASRNYVNQIKNYTLKHRAIENDVMTNLNETRIDESKEKEEDNLLKNVLNMVSSTKHLTQNPPKPLQGGKTLKFYQALARARRIPYSGIKKSDLVRLLKSEL